MLISARYVIRDTPAARLYVCHDLSFGMTPVYAAMVILFRCANLYDANALLCCGVVWCVLLLRLPVKGSWGTKITALVGDILALG